MVLSKQEILELIESEKLVDGFIDLKTQLQPASFDLTLAEVSIIEGGFGFRQFQARFEHDPRHSF